MSNEALGKDTVNDVGRRIAQLPLEKRESLESRLLSKVESSRRRTAIPRRTGPHRPLSFAQRRLWFLDRFEPDSIAYNIPMVLRMTGPLDLSSLEGALTDIVARQEALRTTFTDVGGEPRQEIAPAGPVRLAPVDISDVPLASRPAKASTFLIEQARRRFELERGAVRFTLVRLAEQEHWLLATMHHIVSDGWSLALFQKELVEAYRAHSSGLTPLLPELPLQYSDYAEWQSSSIREPRVLRQLDYWRTQLGGAPALLDLATDRPRPAARNYQGARHTFVVPSGLASSVRQLASRHRATLFMVLLAALDVLLFRHTGQRDICIGSPIAGRTRTELENLIGVFVNTLVLRTELSGELSFAELLERVRRVTLAAYSNQDVPFEKLVEELQPERDPGRTPLFQAMLVVQSVPHAPSTGSVSFERIYLDIGTAKFDLTFFVYPESQGLRVAIEYSTELFDESTVARIARRFLTLLASAVENPRENVSRLALLPEAERRQLLSEWNDTGRDYPRDSSVHELVTRQAERSGDRVAVESDGESLSYSALEERSNQLCRYLQALGVGRETPVGVYLNRSTEMVVALLGVLKSGGAYVPLDPSFPADRIAFMVRDSGLPVLLTQSELRRSLPEVDCRVVELDREREAIAAQSDGAVTARTPAESLAYVIYTSGSTGSPKGVSIEHRSLVNFLWAMKREPGLEATDTLLSVTTLSFDIAGLEIYLPLICGGRVVVASREDAADGRRLAERIRTSGATVMQATPATWRMLLGAGWRGRRGLRIFCGGEPLARDLADVLLDRCDALFNLYGPTETTVWSTAGRVLPGEGPVTAGRPIANTRVYLLDESREPVPMGVPGELYLAGDGLARGYLGRDELTAERFVEDPFASSPSSTAARLYRTGDLARYRAQGEIEVLGRLDHQVKIRGFRIELGEIEAVLAAHPAVRQAAVLVREDASGDKRLAAYIVPEEETSPPSDELRRHSRAKLPDYMVPAHYVPLASFPLTPNGKVDRRALEEFGRERSALDRRAAAPRDALELELAGIWEDLLGTDRVGIHDDFFDAGGHSLLAVRMFAQIEERFRARLPLATLFQAATIAELAAAVRGAGSGGPDSCLVRIQSGGERPPMFCVHAEGGEVLFYREFARLLGADQPVYGLQAQGLDGALPPHATIEEMASHYVEEIRRVQPEGPYFLGGHCYGGIVVFEMAQLLSELGQPVALLAMMDGSAPPNRGSRRDSLRYAWKAFRRSPLGLASYVVSTEIPVRLRRTSRALREHLHRDGGEGPTDARSADRARVQQAIASAYRRYEPKPYAGRITYFMNNQRARLPHDKWQELATEGLELCVFPGTPNTTFLSPSLEALAASVRSRLREAQQSG